MTEDPGYVTRAGVDRVVLDRVRAEHGREAIGTDKPHGLSFGDPAPADPLHGIAAAVAIARAARSRARWFARTAREAGIAWSELAEPLGLDLTDPAIAADPGHHAFREVATEPQSFGGSVVGWRCASCQQWITDKGPYNGHPADDEAGHAEDCARLKWAIRQWRARTDWDDDSQGTEVDR